MLIRRESVDEIRFKTVIDADFVQLITLYNIFIIFIVNR